MPPAFQNVFAEHMAQQLPGMLAHALGLPMPPPAKAVNLVIYGNPGPKMLPSVPVPKPKAPLPGDVNEMPGDVNEIAGDTTEEEGVKRQPEMICLIEIEWLKAPIFQHEMGSDCSCKKRV